MNKLNHVLMLVATATLASQAIAANRPSQHKTICNEGKTCSVAQSTQVAFGRADQFLYKTLSGSFTCDAATFGGRTAGGVNECSVPASSGSGSAGVIPTNKEITGYALANGYLYQPLRQPYTNAFDGDLSTYWQTGDYGPGRSLELIFPDYLTKFDRIVIRELTGNPLFKPVKKHTIEVQSRTENGNAWKTVASGTTIGENKIYELPFGTLGERLRISFEDPDQAVNDPNIAIAEVQVFGSSSQFSGTPLPRRKPSGETHVLNSTSSLDNGLILHEISHLALATAKTSDTANGFTPNAALDRNSETRWQAGFTNGDDFFDLEFPEVVSIGRVVLTSKDDTPRKYKLLSGYQDPLVVYEGTGIGRSKVHEFNGRYSKSVTFVTKRLRIQFEPLASNPRPDLVEIKVFGSTSIQPAMRK